MDPGIIRVNYLVTVSGTTPTKNARFMIMLAAVIRAVHVHGDLLRIAIATPGNDFRLGANEAPPAIISVYTGDLLEEVINELTEEISQKLTKAVGETSREFSNLVSPLNCNWELQTCPHSQEMLLIETELLLLLSLETNSNSEQLVPLKVVQGSEPFSHISHVQ